MPFLFKEYEHAYGKYPDIDSWCAATVYKEFPDIAEEILAESICHTSELPWEDPAVFAKVALIINGREPIAEIQQELSVPEIAYAVNKLHACFADEHFNDAVASYIAAVCIEEGYTIAPKVLSFAQPRIPITQLTPEQRSILDAKLRAVDEVLD